MKEVNGTNTGIHVVFLLDSTAEFVSLPPSSDGNKELSYSSFHCCPTLLSLAPIIKYERRLGGGNVKSEEL